nr:putative reverse transcriptase domain-containing protein [Tanacetum cinerariifolium]
VEELVEIMDREIKCLKQSRILIIKVRWNFRRDLEFTRECEDHFRKKYSHLFTKTAPSTGEILSSQGNVKIISGRSIRTSSQKPHPRQVPHLEPYRQGSFNGGRLNFNNDQESGIARRKFKNIQSDLICGFSLWHAKLNSCICLKLPDQDFVEPSSDEEMVPFIKELGYTSKCDTLSDVSSCGL